MGRIKQFTHGRDLDGISCAIVTNFIFFGNAEKNDVSYEDYHTVNDSIKTFIESGDYKDYTMVLITDLGISEETAKLIQEVHDDWDKQIFVLIDHHDTNEFLNKYSWASVQAVDESGEKISATKLLFRAYQDFIPIKYLAILKEYTDLVSDYDTYIWKDKNNWDAKKMHDICGMYSLPVFKEKMEERLKNLQPFFDESENFAWKLDRKKCEDYINLKMQQV
jgi:oligoribonuclease NrnB/cAMP/cGMP phosphodiesterase (DHH superfamily)